MLSPGDTIGIIGGGQLGRMLAIAAGRLGLRTIILEPDPHCPAAQFANSQIVSAYDDRDGLSELAVNCDVITYEFENVPVLVFDLIDEDCPVFPPRLALEKSQDRLLEKEFVASVGLATAPYAPIQTADQLVDALRTLGGRGILKTRRFGYDGKGQVRFDGESEAAIRAAFDDMAGQDLILEGFVDFEREVSVIGARGQDGAAVFFDPAENVHKNGILATSTLPADISRHVSERLTEATVKILHALNYVGVIGVEFFVTSSGEVLVNEFAPRVHNSGHWTEAACAISQFEQHIRAVSGLPLGSSSRHSDCVMHNLIGSDGLDLSPWMMKLEAVIHLYGKAEAREGRKMGHVTVLSPKTHG